MVRAVPCLRTIPSFTLCAILCIVEREALNEGGSVLYIVSSGILLSNKRVRKESASDNLLFGPTDLTIPHLLTKWCIPGKEIGRS